MPGVDPQARERSSRLPGAPLLDEDAPPLVGVRQRGGRVNNLYRALANQPVLLEAWTDFAWTLRAQCKTPRTLRELLILRAAELTGSRYLWEDHIRFGRQAGLTEDQIQALTAWRESARFDMRERAALELTEQLVLGGRVTDVALSELEEHFSPDEMVELIMTVGFYAMVPRVIDALRVPLPEDLTEGQDRMPGGGAE